MAVFDVAGSVSAVAGSVFDIAGSVSAVAGCSSCMTWVSGGGGKSLLLFFFRLCLSWRSPSLSD